MTIKVKITISLDVDKEDYHLPADEDAGQEIENSLTEFLYDIDGVKIKSIKTIQENMNNYLPTDYQNFIALSRYTRWKDDEQRRETV